jgi:hypothetical protein
MKTLPTENGVQDQSRGDATDATNPANSTNAVCEVCARADFDKVWLPDAYGLPVVDVGLLVCVHCRLVYFPRCPPPVLTTPARPAGPGEKRS